MLKKAYSVKPCGTILILVLLFTMILSMVGLAVIYIFGMEEIASRSEIVSARALYLSDSGIEMTKAWLMNLQRFPEFVNDNRNPFVPPGGIFPHTVAYPDGVNGEISVHIEPYPANNVNIPTHTGVDGYYIIVSSGSITTGTNPGDMLTVLKNVSSAVYISSRTWDLVDQSSFSYRVVPDSWYEKPLQRIYH